jgi:signal peptidase I
MDATRASKPNRWVPVRRICAAAAVAAVVGAMVALGTWPPFATVMSASMEPAIGTSDVVVLRKLERPPRAGEVISVTVPLEARRRYGYPPTVVHRVVKVSPAGDITTKGDARPRPDPFTVRGDAVNARVVWTVPAVGQVIAFLTSTLGLLWLGVGAVLLIALPLIERQREKRAREEETLASLHEELRTVSRELAALREAAEQPPAPEPEPVQQPEEPKGPEDPVEPEPFDFRLDWRVLEDTQPFTDDPPPPTRTGVRRSGGLVGAVERYARSRRYG